MGIHSYFRGRKTELRETLSYHRLAAVTSLADLSCHVFIMTENAIGMSCDVFLVFEKYK